MDFKLGNMFGIHEQALMIRAKRTEVLANNLANADTPGFKAQDLDFQQALAAMTQRTSTNLATTAPGHLSGASSIENLNVTTRTDSKEKLDGNTVDTQREQADYIENAMRYQASLTFLNGRISSLLSAIRGD